MSFLICPSLRQLDVEFMKRLSHSVNIIPVIAKADTMTIEERQEFKQRVSFTNGPLKARLINGPAKDMFEAFRKHRELISLFFNFKMSCSVHIMFFKAAQIKMNATHVLYETMQFHSSLWSIFASLFYALQVQSHYFH